MSDGPIYVRRGEDFTVSVAVYVGQTIDATTTGGSAFEADLRTQSGAVVRALDAASTLTGFDVTDSNGTGGWPVADLYLHARWLDSTGARRELSPPLHVVPVAALETHIVEVSTDAYASLGAYQSGPVYTIARLSRSVDGAGGGGSPSVDPMNIDGGTPTSGPAAMAIDGGTP